MIQKKYIIRLSLILSLVLGMVSCELEEYNPSGTTADAIWSTPEGFQTLVNAAYYNLHDFYGKVDAPFMTEVGTDLWFNQSKAKWHKQTTQYEDFNPSSGNFNLKRWAPMYQSLNMCNAGIGRAKDANFPSFEAQAAKEGELRFLRAFYLWHIVETWGNVYLSTEETQEPVLTAQRSSIADFYSVIISDLEFSIDYLPVDQELERGRASKKSAMGFLARMYLSWAYYADESERVEYFTKARDMANRVINERESLGVSLYSDPADLWNPNNNKTNSEAMFVVSNSSNTAINYGGGIKLYMWFLTNYYDGKPGMNLDLENGYPKEKLIMPTLYLLDLFNENIDARYAASFQEAWYCNDTLDVPFWTAEEIAANGLNPSLVGKRKFGLGDTALLITKRSISNEKQRPYLVIDRDSVYNQDGTIITGRDYISLVKLNDPITRELPETELSTMDVIILRFAEMYLISAEASMQLKDGNAYNKLLELANNRAYGNNGAALLASYGIQSSENVTLEFILDERAREFCGEHMRWFDVKRPFVRDPSAWVKYIKTRNPDITLIDEHHIVRPIPQKELDPLLNKEEFGQNPGY
ncbi:MAG: RagB/SusD family nutrient uptake outer membrane protein [Bacteroidales bacterium]|nr:RagB/SusD family nutrient uptake outer membrane protein [Bacteroidales bacterium]